MEHGAVQCVWPVLVVGQGEQRYWQQTTAAIMSTVLKAFGCRARPL